MGWYESFLDSLNNKNCEEEKKTKKKFTVNELREKLLSDDENPFVEAYPEKEEILKNWFDCTYYRIQAAPASQYCSLIGTVIVVLLPFRSDKEKSSEEKFYDYFKIKPSDFVKKYIDVEANELILPLILEPNAYKNEDIKSVYEPIFKDFKDMGDEKKYPVYANRVQNCLLAEENKTWEEFRKENINITKCKSYEPIIIGNLPIKDPKTEIGEKVAFLKLIGMDSLANDIIGLANQDTNLAVKLGFTANDLYTAPLFYTRKTLKTVASEFDLSIYQEAINGLIKYKERTLGEKIADSIRKDICYVCSSFKSIVSSKKDATDPMEITVPVPKDEESQAELPVIVLKEGYNDMIQEANKKIPKLKREVLRNTDKANEVRYEIVEAKKEISKAYYNEFIGRHEFGLKTIDTTLGFLSSQEVSPILDSLQTGLGTIASFSEILWENKIKIPLESTCIEKWTDNFMNEYPSFKFNPTIYAWQIG